jgi:hypothetical protein
LDSVNLPSAQLPGACTEESADPIHVQVDNRAPPGSDNAPPIAAETDDEKDHRNQEEHVKCGARLEDPDHS